MDLSFTAEDQAFQGEVRRFVADNLPPEIATRVRRGDHLTKDDMGAWNRILADRGWAAPNWPKEHGGAAWSATRRHIFALECAAAGAPELSPFGISMVGPVIIAFGTPAQQAYHLPKILTGEHFWCQGYSEPGSGSDLASLVTRAKAQGEHYLVNGQKIWTTHAHFADWMFCLVRTNPEVKPQAGISFLLIDMATPGITVSPIITVDIAADGGEFVGEGGDLELDIHGYHGSNRKDVIARRNSALCTSG